MPDALPRREQVVIVYSLDGTRRAEFLGRDQPAFLPDGNLVLTAPGGGPGLFVGDVRTWKVTPIRIRGGPADQPDGPEWPRRPSVSPDGRRVAYTSRGRAYVVGIDGTGWTPVWESGTQEPQTQPTFSPDGRFVAVVVVPPNVMTGPGQVVVFDLAKHVRQPLPATQGANSEGPLVWRP